jgi:UDP-glucose 4-epimerase
MLEHSHEPRNPARVLVIGAGFVGGAIAECVRAAGINGMGLKRKELDLLESGATDRLKALLRPDDSVVFVSAKAPARTPALLVENLRMAEPVIEALAAVPPAHLVYVSSDAVYADEANPVTERSPVQPSSLHGMMHAARELMLRSAAKYPLAILRPSLLFGEADPHNGYGPNRFRRQAAKGEAIQLFGEGEETRDHVAVEDVAEIALLTLRQGSAGILNIATGRSHSFRAIAERFAAGTGVPVQGSPRQNPVTHRHFDITDAMKTFPTFRFRPLEA